MYCDYRQPCKSAPAARREEIVRANDKPKAAGPRRRMR
ncbi:hypothetical protein MES5069_310306 [Mesorhizobium escarrei]|uniref:Uncharacterized protein n=1 Tax=Mesorhizobium escarrei TaxID=666018 RepID=A0ABM9E225_9HYPH|nr:hypothetical protein MES5069_310306 [Mesorhizobium escarrei]